MPQKLVEPDGTPGAENAVNCVSIEHKLGVRASPTAVLEYDDAIGFLIGEENCGLEHMFIMMNAARFSVGVQGIALSERSYQRALAYARDRVQSRPVNGKSKHAVPIIEHPDVRRMLMRMRSLTEGGRAMAAATAGLLDMAHHRGDPETIAEAEFMVPLVKGFCTERAVEVASLGIQIHGGMGFIEETGAAQHYRDARILPIYEGTTAIQANDLLGRKVMRDGGAIARLFAARIAETEARLASGDASAQAIGTSLAQARGAFEAALDWMLENSRKDIDAAFAGSVPFLMLSGTLAAGWMLAKGALAAQTARLAISARDNGLYVVTLNRPDKRNALDVLTIEELIRFFSGARMAGVRAVLLEGAGDHFCAGLDLVEHWKADRSADDFMHVCLRWHEAFNKMEYGGVPIIAALKGAVVGGGLELASAAHVRR